MHSNKDYFERVKPIMEKFSKSGIIDSDSDLTILLRHYTILEKLLFVQGERYQFAWRNAYDELTRLQVIKKARKEK